MIRVVLRRARPEELADLTELCLRSKTYWGYDATFIEACREELTLSLEDLKTSHIRVAESCNRPVGVVQLKPGSDHIDLEKLFVDPDVIGEGFGDIMMRWAIGWSGALGAPLMKIVADPGAESFYERYDAVRIGEEPSGSIPGRVLPLMEIKLSDT